jgi:3-oxoacyl-[acyl-carrier protein] reductase
MNLEIEGKAALVTASSSGLGKASAEALVDAGVDVVVNGRDEDRLAATVSKLQNVGSGTVVGQPGDLTEKGTAVELVDRSIEEFGRLDHLVASAGGPPSGSFIEMADSDWYHAFDLLVMSVVRVVREAADHLQADGGGTIVTITSGSVKEAIDSLVLSNSVRMSVIGLEKTLSKELAPDVRANAVLPGSHETERQQELIEQGIARGEYESFQAGRDAKSEGVPLQRMGQPAELGEVVAFLCSEQSSYVNGTAIPVDGGASHSNL